MSAPIITARIHRLACEANAAANQLRESIDFAWTAGSRGPAPETKARMITALLRATDALTAAIADQEAKG